MKLILFSKMRKDRSIDELSAEGASARRTL